jgi:hypothetical protein
MPKCTHDPTDPWAYGKHRRRSEKPCKAALRAYAKYMKTYRIRTNRTRSHLEPNKKDPS